jgi:hypothetical protein
MFLSTDKTLLSGSKMILLAGKLLLPVGFARLLGGNKVLLAV